MAKKKVLAYYLHESEEAAVNDRIEGDAVWTEAFGVGEMDEEAIAELEERGILVEVIEEEAVPADDLPAALGHVFAVDSPATGTRAVAGASLDPVLHPTKENVFVVKLTQPFLLEEWRRQVEDLGVTFLEHLPPSSYTASLTLQQVGDLRALDFVDEVRLCGPDDVPGVAFSQPAAAGPADLGGDVEMALYDVRLHRAEDLDDVVAWMEDNDFKVVGAGRRKLRIELPKDSELARDVEVLPEVAQIQEFVPPELANQVARRLLGLETNPVGADAAALPLTGAGETVAIADSGIDEAHPDFAGRLAAVFARGRPGDASDPHGHGTHVAGSAVGDGSASAGAHRGTAPEASIVFQSVMDSLGGLGGLPIELEEMFEEAFLAGARIHNNSWSADTKSFYTFNALEVDEYVFKRPEFLVVIAAGNQGTSEDPFSTDPGFVDWLSMGSPATAKNALTVGACRSDRTEGGLATRTWRQFSAKRFPRPPIADEKISGDPEALAAFSSRGPCDTSRIKPDLVAPGTDILSARASTAPTGNFWGLADDDHYAFMGGTSMATPLVSGCAALVREHYRASGHDEPSAALLKATLINATRWLSGGDSNADHAKNPNYHQGFGALHMPFAVPNPAEPWMKLEFLDTWKPDGSHGRLSRTGDRRRFAFEVHGGAFLRLCLVWTDPPGPALQNNLGLVLEGPGVTSAAVNGKVPGNVDRPRPLDRMDRANNVQIIRIENPQPGNYLVATLARNLLRPPQDYALVVTGDVGPLQQI